MSDFTTFAVQTEDQKCVGTTAFIPLQRMKKIRGLTHQQRRSSIQPKETQKNVLDTITLPRSLILKTSTRKNREDPKDVAKCIKRLITAEEGIARICHKYKLRKTPDEDAPRSEYQSQLLNYYKNVSISSQKAEFRVKKVVPMLGPYRENTKKPSSGRVSSKKVKSLATSPKHYLQREYQSISLMENEEEDNANSLPKERVILLKRKPNYGQNHNVENAKKVFESSLEEQTLKRAFAVRPNEITLNFRIFSPYSVPAQNLLLKGTGIHQHYDKKLKWSVHRSLIGSRRISISYNNA